MSLDLGGPGQGCSAMRVRRLVAGELAGAEKERTQAHVAGCERCARVQEEIAQEREALRREVPFPAFAAGVAEKLAARPRRPWAARWAPLAAAASVVLVAGAGLVVRRGPTERAKGGASAQLFVQDAAGVRALDPEEAVAPGARLLLKLSPAGRTQAAAVLVEPGETSVVYQGPAVDGPLPRAFEWTGKGVATLLVVLSDSEDGRGEDPVGRRRASRGRRPAHHPAPMKPVCRPLRRGASGRVARRGGGAQVRPGGRRCPRRRRARARSATPSATRAACTPSSPGWAACGRTTRAC